MYTLTTLEAAKAQIRVDVGPSLTAEAQK